MAYNITLSNGQNLVTVADGTTDTTYTSLTLIGKNFAGYGEFLNENFVHLLENFSNATSPANPLQGQVWWDSSNKILKVYNGSSWKTVSSSTSAATAPVTQIIGDLWWDTANGQLKIWSGSQWTVVGPAYTAIQGQSGPVADVVVGANDGQSHVIVKFFISNVLVAILSKDPSFQITGLAGFTVINPGFNLATTTPALGYYGDADNALKLGGVAASDFVRASSSPNFTQAVNITNNAGLTIGANSDLTINASANSVNLISNLLSKSMNFYVNIGGVSTLALYVDGSTGLVMTGVQPTSTSSDYAVATKKYVDNAIAGPNSIALAKDGSNKITGVLAPNTTNTIDLGSSTLKFKTMYASSFNGNATTANYADLAERFEADAIYTPGTIVLIGGEKEVTQVTSELSEEVFGVVSTAPAHLMNADAGSDQTHPAIAVAGRVPVKVIGQVCKGQRLVSAGNGVARGAKPSEANAFNVIGRALQNKVTEGIELIEAVVKLNA